MFLLLRKKIFYFSQDPVTMEDRERFACCCCFCCCGCESEPLDVVVRIPVSGYVPGQTINVELKVMNKSKENIVEFSAGLVKVNI